MSELSPLPGSEPVLHRLPEPHTLRLASAPARPLRILISDDDAEIDHLYTLLLPGYGFEVIAAPYGDGLLTFDLARRKRPHLLITDRYKPGLDGRHLREALRADRRTAGMSVLTVSAVDQPELFDPLADELPKPFTLTELLFRVATLLPLSPIAHTDLLARALALPALDRHHPVSGLPFLHSVDRVLPVLTARPGWAALDLALASPYTQLRARGRGGLDRVLATLTDQVRRIAAGLTITHPGFDMRLTILGPAEHVAAVTPYLQAVLAEFAARLARRSPHVPPPSFRLRTIDDRAGCNLSLLDLRRALV